MNDFKELKDHYIRIGKHTINCAMTIDFSETKEMKKAIKKNIFMHRRGYLDCSSSTVWVYMNQKPMKNVNALPYFWIDETGEVKKSHPDQDVLKQASWDNVKVRSFDMIVTNTSEEGSKVSKKMKDLVAKSSNMTLPIIKRGDDFLKRLVKAIIRSKRISLNNLPSTKQPHLVANMKSALLSDTKTSTNYFTNWTDVLSFDYYFIAISNGRDNYPFEEPIIINSVKGNMVSYMNPEDIKEFLEIMNRAREDAWVKELSTRNSDDVPEESCEVIETESDDDDDEFS